MTCGREKCDRLLRCSRNTRSHRSSGCRRRESGLRAQDGENRAQEVDPESPYDNVRSSLAPCELIRQITSTTGKVSYRDLTYSALRGMLAELDPHSQFNGAARLSRHAGGHQERVWRLLGVVVTMEDGAL